MKTAWNPMQGIFHREWISHSTLRVEDFLCSRFYPQSLRFIGGYTHLTPLELFGKQPLITLVSQILSAKQANPAADTSALEREIDVLVYELYGLTE
ncbi:MAG: hypothetical protein LBI45_01235, partial [Bacteroidales bacterium]|nr:hypothetical protein [Bacteroidales bacterium]